jgi:hypothetical protein
MFLFLYTYTRTHTHGHIYKYTPIHTYTQYVCMYNAHLFIHSERCKICNGDMDRRNVIKSGEEVMRAISTPMKEE